MHIFKIEEGRLRFFDNTKNVKGSGFPFLGEIVPSMSKDLVEGIEATIIYELSGYSFDEIINVVRRSDFAIKNQAYQSFLLDSAKLVSKALDDDVELLIVPQNISYLLRDILDRMKHVRPGLKIIYESFRDFDLDEIQINYEKYNITENLKNKMEGIISDAKEKGVFRFEDVPKQFKDEVDKALNMDYRKVRPEYVYGQNVAVMDDALGENADLQTMIRCIKLFAPAKIEVMNLI